MIDYMGADHMMWGSDYPHEEGFAPHSKLAIRWALHDQSEDACRKILGGNAGRLYRFDLEALAPVAAQIGPTVAEVQTPLGDTGYALPARVRLSAVRGWACPQAACPRTHLVVLC